MDSLRLPPLKFTLPSISQLQSELPPHPAGQSMHAPVVQCHRQHAQSTMPLLPSLSPLLTETEYSVRQRSSPIASYCQSNSQPSLSPLPSSSSIPVTPVSDPPPTPPSKTNSVNYVSIAPVKRSIHTPRGVRDVYTCPFQSCNRISSEHSNMKAHMRLHTGERPYVCRVASCRKSFRWKSSLTYHERALHSNARPYQCVPCRKSFVEKRKLRLHHQLCPAVRAAHAEIIRQQSLETLPGPLNIRPVQFQ